MPLTAALDMMLATPSGCCVQGNGRMAARDQFDLSMQGTRKYTAVQQGYPRSIDDTYSPQVLSTSSFSTNACLKESWQTCFIHADAPLQLFTLKLYDA